MKPKRLIQRLRQLGFKGEIQKMRMIAWRMSRSSCSIVIDNIHLPELGLFELAA